MEGYGLKREHWRKSNQWFSLTTRHAELAVANSSLADAFAKCAQTPLTLKLLGSWQISDVAHSSRRLGHARSPQPERMGGAQHRSGHERWSLSSYRHCCIRGIRGFPEKICFLPEDRIYNTLCLYIDILVALVLCNRHSTNAYGTREI